MIHDFNALKHNYAIRWRIIPNALAWLSK